MKFRAAKQTHVTISSAKFHVNRCNESPLRGENADYWPGSKNNTGSLPLCGILPVISNRLDELTRKVSSIVDADTYGEW